MHDNLLPNEKILKSNKLKALAEDKIKVVQIMISVCGQKFTCGLKQYIILYWIGSETLWEKEKMLVTSIFSFSHNVFKKLLFQGR